MQQRCEIAVRRILPTFRSLIAKELVNEYGLSQVEVAEKLGITQASVSHYISMKRAKGALQQPTLLNKTEELAKKTAKELSENKISLKEAMSAVCRLCAEIGIIEKNQ